MGSKKKQKVAIAMAIALSVSTVMSSVAAYAQEENPDLPILTQETGGDQKNDTPSAGEIDTASQDNQDKAKPVAEESEPVQNVGQQSQVPTFNVNADVATLSTDIDINGTNFPDLAFKQYIIDTFDIDKNGKLSAAEISNINVININNKKKIKSLQGIEFFTTLIRLECSNTGITELDVSKNINLTELVCNNTGISELDVSKNINLTELVCNNTGIAALDVSKNTDLTLVNCFSTGITELDVSKNINLTLLNCSNTGITELDVSKNINLTELVCNNTGIAALDVSKNTDLIKLLCNNTGITELDVSKNINLTLLQCSNTGITELDVSKNINLTLLNCSNTGITELDVSKNINLTLLQCDGTGITELDVSKNTDLIKLLCNNTGITKLDVSKNINLTLLQCYNTGIVELDVSKNINLTELLCNNTGITELDVSKNINLIELWCNNTGITELDVSKNTDLRNLWCNNTGITELDVSKNVALIVLGCPDTGITELDVSNNVALETLWCPDSLGWLNIGNNENLYNLTKSDFVFDIEITDKSFNIKHMFPGIDLQKMTIISGETLDKSTGIISGYTSDTSIVYEYDCGTSMDGNETLTVTLRLYLLKSDSKINIKGSLNKEYTGKPYEIPEIKTEGSKGKLTIDYFEYKDGIYQPIKTTPINAGKYAVRIELEEDDHHDGAVIERTFFKITQATNSWTEELTMTGWTYGEAGNTPTAKAKYGDVIFTYSKTENGTYTNTAPTDAGTYYVKANVEGTSNYTGVESIKAFTIALGNVKDNDNITNNDMSNTGSIQTGDSIQTGLLATLSILSAGCIALLAGKIRSQKKEEN